VDDASWYDIALPWLKVDRLALQINKEMPVENKEELVVGVMLVPVVLALHDSQTDYRVVYPAERLVVPLVCAGTDERRQIDYCERRELDIEIGSVWMVLRFTHRLFLVDPFLGFAVRA